MLDARITRIIGLQIAVTLVISVGLLLVFGKASGASAFLGGAVGFCSALAYALRASVSRGRSPRALLQAQMAGESSKFVVTVILFSLVFSLFKSLRGLEFFLTYIATLLVYFAALLLD